jgi:hypothetical protein
MRLLVLLCLSGLVLGLPHPEEEDAEEDEAAEEDEEYDVYDAVEDAAEGTVRLSSDALLFSPEIFIPVTNDP